MKTMCKAGLVAAALGAVLGLAAPAQADDTTTGNDGLVSGDQFNVPIYFGVNVSGNGVGIAGVGEAVGK